MVHMGQRNSYLLSLQERSVQILLKKKHKNCEWGIANEKAKRYVLDIRKNAWRKWGSCGEP